MSRQKPFPDCNILGVNIAVTNMKKTVDYLAANLGDLSGSYICVSNVHTTVMSYEDRSYRDVQNGAVLALPDGKPLSVACQRRGFAEAERVAGPDLMREIFLLSVKRGWRHYFYGSTQETLKALDTALRKTYPGLAVAGMEAPPFRPLTAGEDQAAIHRINLSKADFVWVGLGAPKQERWMAEHQGRVQGLMIGVGAGFDYHGGRLKRAPLWMQEHSLEWLYRLRQEPVRLFKRYLITNTKYLWLVNREDRQLRKRKR